MLQSVVVTPSDDTDSSNIFSRISQKREERKRNKEQAKESENWENKMLQENLNNTQYSILTSIEHNIYKLMQNENITDKSSLSAFIKMSENNVKS